MHSFLFFVFCFLFFVFVFVVVLLEVRPFRFDLIIVHIFFVLLEVSLPF